MASLGRSASADPFLAVADSVVRLLTQTTEGDASCADAMAALCLDRAAEIAAIPVPVAVALLRDAVNAAARALGTGAAAGADVLAALRHVLACPTLRDVAIKASRLKSLVAFAISALADVDRVCADSAAVAVLQVLQEAGVDITVAGTLDSAHTPLNLAILHSFFGAAQVLLAAGADVNGLFRDGKMWLLAAAAAARSDAGMAWLLEHGASLTLANSRGHTIAHVLAGLSQGEAVPLESAKVSGIVAAGAEPTQSVAHRAVGMLALADARSLAQAAAAHAEFCCRWLRRVIAAEPSLLEARDGQGLTPLMSAIAGESAEVRVAVLLELGADVSAAGADGWTALSLACNAMSLPVVRQLIAAGAASAAALPPGSRQARCVAKPAMIAACLSERGCRECAARCGGSKPGNCADGLDILRAVLAAGVREAVDENGHSLWSRVGTWLGTPDESKRISAEHAVTVLQALHAAGVDVLAQGVTDPWPILHAAVEAAAPAVVRWLVAEAGAPLEERDIRSYTPLLIACHQHAWSAALALLAAGARVDIEGKIGGSFQTIADWARRSPTCKHRGVKLAIAARAREHAVQAAAIAKGLPSGSYGAGAGPASAAAAPAAAGAGSGRVGVAPRAAPGTGKPASTAVVVGAASATGKGKQPKGRKGRLGAASNRAEELPLDDEAAEVTAPCAAAAATGGSLPSATCGGVRVPALAAAPAGTASSAAALSTCEDPAAAAAGAAVATGTAGSNAPETLAASASALNLPEDRFSQRPLEPSGCVDALGPPARSIAAGICAEGSGSAGAVPTGASCNSCEPGEGAAFSDAAIPMARPQTAEPGAGTGSAGTAGASLIAALQDEGASAGAVRRHLVALSELARDPAAAAALQGQGAIAAIGAAVARHGAAVGRAAGPLLTVLISAAAEGSEVECEEDEA